MTGFRTPGRNEWGMHKNDVLKKVRYKMLQARESYGKHFIGSCDLYCH